MQERQLELGRHCLVVALEGFATSFQLDELLASRQNSGDSSDEADDLHVVCPTADVWQRRADALHDRGELELGGCGVEDIETPGQGEEGDREVDRGGVKWVAVTGVRI